MERRRSGACYMIFYLCFFNYLEYRTGVQVHMLQMRADYKIPFCEYFIVPYLLWFPYVGLTAAYFTLFNDNRTEFYQFAVCMGIGMERCFSSSPTFSRTDRT